MRTYEVAAIGAPVLAEDTEEHREILGAEGDTVMFFSNESEMLEKCAWLIAHPHEGAAMGRRLMRRIREGRNTYGDRLDAMLKTLE
jgi:spore maturation protein CgeB